MHKGNSAWHQNFIATAQKVQRLYIHIKFIYIIWHAGCLLSSTHETNICGKEGKEARKARMGSQV